MAPLISRHPDGAKPGGGFPPGVAFTPVPSPLMGELLERINDLDELKIILRMIWLLNKKPAAARFAAAAEMSGDGTVAVMLGAYGDELAAKIDKGLTSAAQKGIFLTIQGSHGTNYALNTEPMRRLQAQGATAADAPQTEPLAAPKFELGSDAVAAAYEENIGIITPVVGEKLQDLLNNYDEKQILGAITTAALKGARTVRFIEVVLKNNDSREPKPTGPGHAEQAQAGPGEDHQRPVDDFLRRIQPRQST